jgi:hypothetical protein
LEAISTRAVVARRAFNYLHIQAVAHSWAGLVTPASRMAMGRFLLRFARGVGEGVETIHRKA